MADTEAGDFPVWHTPEGEPVSCVEKIKVLNENLAELRALGAGRARRRGADGVRRSPGARGSRRHHGRSRQPLSPMRLAPALLALAGARSRPLPALSPAEMTAEPLAVLQGLDKITARVSRFDAPVGQMVSFGTLSIVVRDCRKSAPEDRPENAGFIQIYENRPGEERSAAVQRLDVLVEPGVVGARAPGLRRQPARLQRRIAAAGAAVLAPTRRQIARKDRAIAQRLGEETVIARRGKSRSRRIAPDAASGTACRAGGSRRACSRATRWTSATLLASVTRLNMLSPKKAAPSETP